MPSDSSLSSPPEDTHASDAKGAVAVDNPSRSVKVTTNGKKRKATTPVKAKVTKRTRKTTSIEDPYDDAEESATAPEQEASKPKIRKTSAIKTKVEQTTVEKKVVDGEAGDKTVAKSTVKKTRKKKEDVIVGPLQNYPHKSPVHLPFLFVTKSDVTFEFWFA